MLYLFWYLVKMIFILVYWFYFIKKECIKFVDYFIFFLVYYFFLLKVYKKKWMIGNLLFCKCMNFVLFLLFVIIDVGIVVMVIGMFVVSVMLMVNSLM